MKVMNLSKTRTLDKKRLYIKLLSTLLLIIGFQLKAQQLPLFTQYLFNKYVFNPAVTGTEDNFSATANYRYQWQGVTDAPRTYIMSVHGPHKFKSFGLGGALYTDVTGPTSKTGAYLSYAYHLQVTDNTKLSLGLSGGLLQYRVDGTKITLADPGDLALVNTLLNKVIPDFGFGGYWYGDKFYVGLSVPQFIQGRLDFSDDGAQSLSRLTSHFYLNSGYTFNVNNDFGFEPSMMMRFSYPVIPQLDIAFRAIYQDSYYLGLMRRTQDAFAVMAGYQTVNKKFTFGYSYDITQNELSVFSNGSHELMVKATFGDIKSKHRSQKFKKKRRSKLDRLEKKLKRLGDGENTEGESIEDGDMEYYDDSVNDKTNEKSTTEADDSKTLEQKLAAVEQKDRMLRAKVRVLRDEAEAAGYNSPNDSGFPKRNQYLEALDQIKEVYRQKKELDALLD